MRAGTCVITGAAGHLGRAIARWCVDRAAAVVLVDRDANRLATCERALNGGGAKVVSAAVDLTDTEAIADMIAGLPAGLWSTPPSLIAAHGIAGRSNGVAARIGSVRKPDWEATLDANLTSVVFLIQSFLPLMAAAGGGRIVLVASAAGIAASPTASLAYAVSKAGVAALPRLLAPELGAAGVLINAVAPGKFTNPDWPDSPEQVAKYADTIPLRRLASVEEVAALAGFLASEANTYLTGQTILQDGGRLSGALPATGPR